MAWARLDDGYFTNRKVAALSKDAKLLDLAAIAFSARELRDGELTRTDIRMIAAQVDVEDVRAVADELVKAERWSKADGGGYRIHDYLKYNFSREEILSRQSGNAQRQSAWRERHVNVTSDAPSSNGITNAVSDASVTAAPYPVPVPSPVTDSSQERVRPAAAVPRVDEAFKRKLEDGFCEQLGSRETVRAHIGAALAHTSRQKYTDDRAYVIRWLQDDAQRALAPPGRNGRVEPRRRIVNHTGCPAGCTDRHEDRT